MLLLTTFLEAAVFLLPLLGGGIFHGLVMKYRVAPGLARPIDGGRSWRGVRLFGDNKTWRGLLAAGLGVGASQALVFLLWGDTSVFQAVFVLKYGLFSWFIFGFVVGFMAMVGELPNSFLKRRLGIAPGTGAGGRYAALFYLLDQIDLLLFAMPIWAWAGALTWPRTIMVVMLVTVVHQALSSIGYRLGMRKTPR